MPHYPNTARHTLPLAAIMAVMLSACGGGGSGGDNSSPAIPPVVVTPPAVNAEAPLLLTAANAESVPLLALGYGVTPLAVAQMVMDWSTRLSSSGTVTRPCTNGGSQSAAFIDTDGNGRVGTGDKLTLTYTNCRVKELAGVVEGTINIAFNTPSDQQQLAGIITFAPGFGDHTEIPRQDMLGSVRFDYASSALSRRLHVYSDTQPFIMALSDATTKHNETITALDVTHELHLNTARTATNLRLRVASSALGGSFDVTTRTPLSSWFDTIGDAGELTISGANNTKAGLRVNASFRNRFDTLFGDTVVGKPDSLEVDLLWSSGDLLPGNQSRPDYYDTSSSIANGFKLLVAPDTGNMTPRGKLSWVYSRTLATPAFSDAVFAGIGIGNVDAIISQDGTIVTVTPASQLKAGGSYELRINTRSRGEVKDVAGNILPVSPLTVNVLNTIQAQLDSGGMAPILLGPAAALTLDASKSTANGAPVSNVRWRQLSGPPLNIDNPTAPRMTLTGTNPAKGVAVVELEAINAANESDKRQISIEVLTDISKALVFSSSNNGGIPTIDSNADTISAPYARYWADSSTLDIMSTKLRNRLLMGLPAGLRWQAGLSASYGTGNSDGVTGSYIGDSGCFTRTGSFRVIDFVLDTAGNPSKVAIDIDENCSGTVNKISIRYGSDVPLRK